MNILEKVRQGFVYFDGGMGTLLQEKGLRAGEIPEYWNVTHPEIIQEIHEMYLQAGADIVTTCTFGANPLKLKEAGSEISLRQIIEAAVGNAKKAVETAGKGYVALDIGPSGKLMKPLGDLEFEEAVSAFGEAVRIGAAAGADLIAIETMADTYELKAAVLAAKENCDLPVFATVTFDRQSRMLTGADPEAAVALLEGLRVDALGVNCGLGPSMMKSIVEELTKYSSLPVIVNPNAGLPQIVDGRTTFAVTPEEFAREMQELAEAGARILGGCCGTAPEHIRCMTERLKKMEAVPVTPKNRTVVSSYTHAVTFGAHPRLIGERINPTGKSRLKQALRERDFGYILREGIAQQEGGVDLLDVNAGLPEIDETEMLGSIVEELQGVLDLPLQIDTADSRAMERAMRLYNGKPLVNSVNGKQESMDAVFPLVQKYGGVVIGLTLDEDGIPPLAEGRYAVAEKIYREAEKYGIGRNDIIIDPLALTISAESSAAVETLKAVRLIKNAGGLSSLGVSNVSFGLPCRDAVNATFFALALEAGLSAAIMNPKSTAMQKAYRSYCALAGLDAQCAEYISYAEGWQAEAVASAAAGGVSVSGKADNEVKGSAAGNLSDDGKSEGCAEEKPLMQAVVRGLRDQAAAEARRLAEEDPLVLIQEQIVPALNIQGKGFEQGTVFLPQLLMSAEAAGAAFDILKERMEKQDETIHEGIVVLATVKGDIHDIGKNIVKVLLENYGFRVLDLGKDVAPERILEAALENNAPLVGLSALMTTTVPAMEETIRLLRKEAPGCRVVVGGAVLNQEYADQMGADCYSPDAMETVRYAEAVLG